MKGTYILVIFLEKSKNITIGLLGTIFFPRGYYLYVGSAMGKFGASTLLNRVKRHTLPKNEKKVHWHIDYLLADKHSFILKIYLVPSLKPLECLIAQELFKTSENHIKGFGSSDCSCISHLFYYEKFTELLEIFI